VPRNWRVLKVSYFIRSQPALPGGAFRASFFSASLNGSMAAFMTSSREYWRILGGKSSVSYLWSPYIFSCSRLGLIRFRDASIGCHLERIAVRRLGPNLVVSAP